MPNDSGPSFRATTRIKRSRRTARESWAAVSKTASEILGSPLRELFNILVPVAAALNLPRFQCIHHLSRDEPASDCFASRLSSDDCGWDLCPGDDPRIQSHPAYPVGASQLLGPAKTTLENGQPFSKIL